MPQSNWETFHTAYLASDQKTKDILRSSLIPECVNEIIKKFELDKTHQKTLVQIFSNKVLGLLNEESTIDALRKEGIPAAKVIHTEISTCLSTKKPTIADTSFETETELNSDLSSDIAETEAALEAMPKNLPVTSAADQPSEQTKTASTPSIPIQQPATPPTPTFSQPPQPQHQETYRVPPSAPPTLAQSYRADKSASMRTMAEDMRAVHDQEPTYTSTQSAILRENRQPQPSKEPRWGED